MAEPNDNGAMESEDFSAQNCGDCRFWRIERAPSIGGTMILRIRICRAPSGPLHGVATAHTEGCRVWAHA